MNSHDNEVEWSSCILTTEDCGTENYLDVEDCGDDQIENMSCCGSSRNDFLDDNIGCTSYDLNRSNSVNDLSCKSWESAGGSCSTYIETVSDETNMIHGRVENASSAPTNATIRKRNCVNAFGNSVDSRSEFLDGDVENAYHAIFGEEIDKKGPKCSPNKKEVENKTESTSDYNNVNVEEKEIENDSKNKRKSSPLVPSKKSRLNSCQEFSDESKDVLYSTGTILCIMLGDFRGYTAEVIVVIDNRKIPFVKKSKYGGVHYVVAPIDYEGEHLGSCLLLPQTGLLPDMSLGDESREHFVFARNLINRSNNDNKCDADSNMMTNNQPSGANKDVGFNSSYNSPKSSILEGKVFDGSHEGNDTKLVNAKLILNKIRGASSIDCLIDNVIAPTTTGDFSGYRGNQACISSGSSCSKGTSVECEATLSGDSNSSATTDNNDNNIESISSKTSNLSSSASITEIYGGKGCNIIDTHSLCTITATEDSNKIPTTISSKSTNIYEPINTTNYYQMILKSSSAQLRLDKYLALRTTDMRTVGRRVRVTAESSKYR